MEFLPREIRVAFPGESHLRQSRATQPTVHARCFSVSTIHRTLTSATGTLTCVQMLMHAIARGGVQTPKESLSWKLTLGLMITLEFCIYFLIVIFDFWSILFHLDTTCLPGWLGLAGNESESSNNCACLEICIDHHYAISLLLSTSNVVTFS